MVKRIFDSIGGRERPDFEVMTATVLPEVPLQAAAVQPVVPAAEVGDSGSTPMCAAS
jgi:hypothetical protein